MLFAIAAGGALGSIARYLIGTLVATRAPGFPWATLLINVTGSLLFAFLFAALTSPAQSPALRAGLTTGFCGGYTTFSTFSYETFALLEDGEWTRAGLYAALSVVLALVATIIGFMVARGVITLRAGA